MDFIYFILDFIPSFIYGSLLFLILSEFAPLRFESRILSLADIILIMLSGNILVYPSEVTGTLGSLFLLTLSLLLLHKGQWYMKLSAVLILFPAMTAVSFLCQDLGTVIWLYGSGKTMSAGAQTLLYLFTRFLRVPAWYLIRRCVKIWLPEAIGRMTVKMWLILDLISFASFAGIIIIIYKCGTYDSYFAWPACIASLITSMGCCFLCTYMSRITQADMELQTWQYRQSYYQEIENSQQTVRRMRHDMRNHLAVAGTLLREGRFKDAEDYLGKLDQEFSVHTRLYCSDPISNAVLNAKMSKCEEFGIPCEFRVDLKEMPQISDIDLCSLFANTLDNAIEACQKMPQGSDRRITLNVRCINGYFSYEIINTKSSTVKEKNGIFETDKDDPLSHGIGLKNVRQIIQKYGGECRITYTDREFRVIAAISDV